jgi:hypothetical protein
MPPLMALDTLRTGGGPNADWAAVELIGLRAWTGPDQPGCGGQRVRALCLAARNGPCRVRRVRAPLRHRPACPALASCGGAAGAMHRRWCWRGRRRLRPSVLSGLAAGEATPQDRLAEVWRQVLYGLVFGVVPQDFPAESAPPVRVGFAPGRYGSGVCGVRLWTGCHMMPPRPSCWPGMAQHWCGQVGPRRAVPVLAQAEFLSITPATRADRGGASGPRRP